METTTNPNSPDSTRFGALLPEDVERFNLRTRGFRHNTRRSDHDGTWQDCQTCWHVCLNGAAELGAKTIGPDAIGREDALALMDAGRTGVKHLAISGERKQRVRDGLPAKASAAATTAFLKTKVADGFAGGALTLPPAIVLQVLELAIEFASDSGERVPHGDDLPYQRMARGIVVSGRFPVTAAAVELT